MKGLLGWLKPTFEGHDGRASFRRLSAFSLLALMIYGGIVNNITSIFSIYALGIYATTFLLLVGIITADTLTQVLKGKQIEYLQHKDEVKCEDDNAGTG